jgi:hypothetical protein
MKSLTNPYAFLMNSRAHYKIKGYTASGLSAEVRPVITLGEARTAGDIRAETDAHPELDSAAHICRCRDKCLTVRLILKPHSIMILGGGKRWWPTAKDSLASVLK